MRTFVDAELFTRRYPGLRGLEMAPIWGALMLTFLAESVGWIREGDVIPHMTLMGLTLAGVWQIHRYLDRTYGVVRPLSAGWGWFAVGVVTYYVLQIGAIRTGVRIDLTAPFLGLWAASFAWRDRGFRKHWLVPALVGFLMPFVVPYPTPPSAGRSPAAGVWWAVMWAAFMLASLWDHRLLVRSVGDART